GAGAGASAGAAAGVGGAGRAGSLTLGATGTDGEGEAVSEPTTKTEVPAADARTAITPASTATTVRWFSCGGMGFLTLTFAVDRPIPAPPGISPTDPGRFAAPAAGPHAVGVNGTTVGYLAALRGGVISFASPCVLPLVPAYLSVVTGLD